jgi:lipopolysaccharide/colanic/teichoic acid biosynthesis glycosyltransferase
VAKRKKFNNEDVLAHQRITDHEKLCHIMQKETNKRIEDLHKDVHRLEKIMLSSTGFIMTTMIGLIVALVVKIF